MRVGTRVAAEFDRHFAASGMTQAQFRLLLRVHEAGPAGIAPSLLADALLIERAAVTRLAGRLIESGHLARAPGENRRTFNLILTEKGSSHLAQSIPQAMTLAGTLLDPFTSSHLSGMADTLAALEERLRSEIDAREDSGGGNSGG